MQVAQILKSIIGTNMRPANAGNRLMPYSNQYSSLIQLMEIYRISFSALNMREWNKIMELTNVFTDTTGMTDKERSMKKNRLESLGTRSSFLVNETIRRNLNTFIIMDGYGTTLNNIISELVSKGCNLDHYNFIVVDNDSNVNKWHQHFFPNNVRSVKSDIFDFACGYGKADCSRAILYLNFCGIGGDKNGLRLLQFMQNYDYPFLVSYSRNRGAYGMYSYLESFFELKNGYDVDKERNKTFKTVFIE